MKSKPWVGLLLISLFCLGSFSVAAKSDSVTLEKTYKNTIILENSYFYFPKIFDATWTPSFVLPIPYLAQMAWGDQFSVYYERKISQKIKLGGGYTMWNTFPSLGNYIFRDGPHVISSRNYLGVGAIAYRAKYKMVDVYGTYDCKHLKRHNIALGGGGTYSLGENTIIDSIVSLPGNQWEEYFLYATHRAHYYGVIALLKYNYIIIKNRISIGGSFKFRKYFGLYSSQLDYGVNLAVNLY